MSYKVTDMLSPDEASDYQQSCVDYLRTGSPVYGQIVRAYERSARKRYGGAIPATDALF